MVPLYKKLGYCSLFLNDNLNAIKYFKKIPAINKEYEILILLSIISFNLGKRELSLNYISRFAKFFKTVHTTKQIGIFIHDMLVLLGEIKFSKYIKLIQENNFENKNILLYQISYFGIGFGFYDLPKQILMDISKKSKSLLLKSKCSEAIGIMYSNLDNYDLAIKFYKEAVEIDNRNFLAYRYLASCYMNTFDYINSKKYIDIAYNTALSNNCLPSDLSEIDLYRSKIESLFRHVLNYKKIKSDIAQKIFFTSERTYFDYINKIELFNLYDASSIITNYAKGLEIILNDVLTPLIHPYVKRRISNKKNQPVSKDFEKKFNNIVNNKTISLGTWSRIIIDIYKSNIKKDLQQIRDLLNTKYDKNALFKIKVASEFI